MRQELALPATERIMETMKPVRRQWAQRWRALMLAAPLFLVTACADEATQPKSAEKPMPEPEKLETATFGAGCFWCTEAVMDALDGVYYVESGYMGGHVDNPTYREVCNGTTGHAEVIQVRYDPEQVSFATLLDTFWVMHDPTTLNRQGADVGTQYRSAIFYHSDAQRETAEASKQAAQAHFSDRIVTEITEASTFYPAEDYHQDYFELNPNAGYCQFVIAPKLKKLGLD
ncbi:MAG: peptide-methionine (S)-S-oxide reductase MsrA [Puniceicoccales bacterium]